jgi:hypothetical protein
MITGIYPDFIIYPSMNSAGKSTPPNTGSQLGDGTGHGAGKRSLVNAGPDMINVPGLSGVQKKPRTLAGPEGAPGVTSDVIDLTHF